MAMQLSQLSLEAVLSFTQPNASRLFPKNPTNKLDISESYTNGSGVGELDTLAIDEFSIPAGGTLTIDVHLGTWSNGVATGTLTNNNGEHVQFASLKVLLLQLFDLASGSTSVQLDASDPQACLSVGGIVKAGGTGVGSLTEGHLTWCDPSAAGADVNVTSNSQVVVVNLDGSHVATIALALGGVHL